MPKLITKGRKWVVSDDGMDHDFTSARAAWLFIYIINSAKKVKLQ